MPVTYEVYAARENGELGPWPLYMVYDREEDAVRYIHTMAFPGLYHIVKVTTESELAGVIEVEETEEFLEEMRQLRKRVEKLRTISPETDTTDTEK